MMAKREVHYPHIIGFRLTDKTWFQIQQQIAETDLTSHDWCRLVLDRLNHEYGLSRKERYFLHQILRRQWLVAQGFHLLGDDRLTVERWKRFRDFARQNVELFVKLSSDEFQSVMDSQRHQNPIDVANRAPADPIFGED